MLRVSGVNFNTQLASRMNLNKNRARFQPTLSKISFGMSKEVLSPTEKVVKKTLSQIFEMEFEKSGNKFLSKDPIPLYGIEDNKKNFNMLIMGNLNLLHMFDDKAQLGLFAKKISNVLALKSLVFTGAEGQIFFDRAIGLLGSKFSLTKVPTNKINTVFLSTKMKIALEKEFAKNNEVLKVSFGREKFMIKSERMYSDDNKSPIRNIIVEKLNH